MSKIVGANPLEVVLMNTLTVNLHFMMIAFYKPTTTRHKILIEKKAFPSDYHAVISQIQYHGFLPETSLLEVAPREGEDCVRPEDLEALITTEGDSIALILMSGVHFFTGQLFDIPTITRLGHAKGCVVGIDLAHAVGNVPLHLHEWGVDFACWCMYKYMNCGPGSVGGCFVHEKHGKPQLTYPNPDSKYPLPVPHRLAGWWGHRLSDRFAMEPVFLPAEGADGFRVSNPPMISIACISASLKIFDRVSNQ
jgi:kynureninase